MSFNPKNILVIDFGQLGDVVLSLPALGAIRTKFPRARITVAVGKASAPIVELAGVADAVLPVDRVALRDGNKVLSILSIAKLVREVRRRSFDFVIDLHSLSETNLLGFLSKAPHRLFGRRPGRSLDFLSKFHARPPVEDRAKHATDRYLDVLAPLGIGKIAREPRLLPRAEDIKFVDELLKKEFKTLAKRAAREGREFEEAPMVGLFPGAGHESRKWSLERFIELAARLERNQGVQIVVFLGPEERRIASEIRAKFSPSTIIFDRLTLPQLAAALARLSVFVSNDTGPLHVAAAVGAPTVMLLGHPTMKSYAPIGSRHRVIHGENMNAISVEAAYEAARAALVAPRTEALFAR